jgi:enamine deaminase RidA (YjgF/YER057c/UK114 family)
METNTRRKFLGNLAAIGALFTGATKLFGQQTSAQNAPGPEGSSAQSANRQTPQPTGGSQHVQNGIYYFSGIGSNDGYPKEDHILVTEPFEKHVTRTMVALKKSVERSGCTMDSIIHLDVFLCLPLADGTVAPTGKARFDAHKAQYDALNEIYRTYFSEGKTPSRACVAVDWIPGDSLIEIVGCAAVVTPAAEK